MAAQNIQDTFLNTARKEKIPLTIHIVNGFQINGALVQGFDSFAVLVLVGGKQMLLYKHAISTVTPDRNIDMETEK